MLQNSSLIKSLFLLILHFTFIYSSSPSTPPDISMWSVNMKHILTWSPLQVPCSSVNYSVQFQGEYELHKLNGTWVDAHDCQEIHENQCDLTLDLASDSEYSIRLITKCDGRKSWTQLPVTFNRRDTVLLAPKMTVAIEGDLIHVGFNTTFRDMTFNLRVWIEGDEQNAMTHVIRTQPYHFTTDVHRGEKKMCFRAEALLEAVNKSCSTNTQCVNIFPPKTPNFGIPIMVSIAVVVLVALAIILGCSATRFGAQIKQTICHREPLPSVLLNDCRPSTHVLCMNVPLEQTDSLLLLCPAEGQWTFTEGVGSIRSN